MPRDHFQGFETVRIDRDSYWSPFGSYYSVRRKCYCKSCGLEPSCPKGCSEHPISLCRYCVQDPVDDECLMRGDCQHGMVCPCGERLVCQDGSTCTTQYLKNMDKDFEDNRKLSELQTQSATKIQRFWRKCRWDPQYLMCESVEMKNLADIGLVLP